MQDSRDPVRRLWHPKRRAKHLHSPPLLAAERRPTILSIEAPFRVVRRCRYGAHLMTLGDKPGSHFPRILTDTRRLGRKIRAVYENFHAFANVRRFGAAVGSAGVCALACLESSRAFMGNETNLFVSRKRRVLASNFLIPWSDFSYR